MEDEELDLFSLKGMKKKKKKKKTQKREKKVKPAAAEKEGQVAPALSDADNRAILEDDEELDIFKIKRKRKKATPAALPEPVEEPEEDVDGADEDEDDLALVKVKRRKDRKKPKNKVLDEDEDDDESGSEDVVDHDDPREDDRDYTYQELLSRVYANIRRDRPELQDNKKKMMIKPPQVLPFGSRKTIIMNFVEICSTMHREPEHCLSYLLAELGTSGSLDGQQRLVLKGRFQPKGVENIIRRYIGEYVACKLCKGADTILTRDQATRLHYVECQSCAAKRSVPPIKMGFSAQIGRRQVVGR